MSTPNRGWKILLAATFGLGGLAGCGSSSSTPTTAQDRLTPGDSIPESTAALKAFVDDISVAEVADSPTEVGPIGGGGQPASLQAVKEASGATAADLAKVLLAFRDTGGKFTTLRCDGANYTSGTGAALVTVGSNSFSANVTVALDGSTLNITASLPLGANPTTAIADPPTVFVPSAEACPAKGL